MDQSVKNAVDSWINDPAIAEDRDALADYLYPRMQSASHFHQIFDKLDGREREWIYLLTVGWIILIMQ